MSKDHFLYGKVMLGNPAFRMKMVKVPTGRECRYCGKEVFKIYREWYRKATGELVQRECIWTKFFTCCANHQRWWAAKGSGMVEVSDAEITGHRSAPRRSH